MPPSAATIGPRHANMRSATSRIRDLSIDRFSSGTLFSVDTDDFDEFRQYAQGWSIEHQLQGANTPHSALSGVFTPSLQIAVAQHSMGYRSQGRNPQGTLSIIVPLDERPMKYRGQVIDQMQMPLIRSVDGFELVCGAGAHFLAVTVAEDKAERYAAEVARKPLMWRQADRLRFPDPSYQLRYTNALTSLLMAVKACPTLLNEQPTTALLEERLLECLPLDAYGDSHVAGDRSRFRVARQAYRFLHDRIDTVPSIRDLCVVTGTSYATLERGFREMYGTTPKILIQDLRLSRVRNALLHPSPSTTVTAVALHCGFLEFGRFAVQYRQRFGEVPSETLRRARGDSWPRWN